MRARPTSSDEAFAAARVAYTRARDPTLAIELFDDALDLLDEEAKKRSPARRDDATTRRGARESGAVFFNPREGGRGVRAGRTRDRVR